MEKIHKEYINVGEGCGKALTSPGLSEMLKERARPVPARALIIPIIMAHYENVINNTEDIVVAISHMVVGLCSVTNSPLASTYVCQKRASMTSVSSAHLALPEEKVAGEMSISSSFSSSE